MWLCHNHHSLSPFPPHQRSGFQVSFSFSAGLASGVALLLLFGCITAIALSPQASPPAWLFFFCMAVSQPPPHKKPQQSLLGFTYPLTCQSSASFPVQYVAVSQPPSPFSAGRASGVASSPPFGRAVGGLLNLNIRHCLDNSCIQHA